MVAGRVRFPAWEQCHKAEIKFYIMNKKERLAVYKELKRLYETRDKLVMYKSDCYSGYGISELSGMCAYLWNTHGLRICDFPELEKREPSCGWYGNYAFWFAPDDIESRVNVLTEVINNF